MVDIHVYIHDAGQQNTKLDQIITMLQQVLNKETSIMATLDDAVAATAAEKTVVDSAVALLNNLTTMLQAAINTGDPAKVQSVVDSITAQTAELSAAVAANTPAAPPAPAPTV